MTMTNVNKLPSHKVPISLVMDVVACSINSPRVSLEQLCAYTGKSMPYVRSALNVSLLLGMVKLEEASSYCVDESCLNHLGKVPTEGAKLKVFREYLERWEPLILFIRFCESGNTANVAARKVYVTYSFQGQDFMFLKDLLLLWGTKTEIFTVEGQNVVLPESVSQHMSEYDLSFEVDPMAIRLQIISILGEEIFAFMSHHEIKELSGAFYKTSSNPRDAIEGAGRAFEDFLRRISDQTQVDVRSANGIGQVVNRLYNNKDSTGQLDNKIHHKHSSIGASVGDIRNMAGHSLEGKTMERWDLTPELAKLYVYMVLTTVRSIYSYVIHDTFTF